VTETSRASAVAVQDFSHDGKAARRSRAGDRAGRSRPAGVLFVIAVAVLSGVAGLLELGTWQLHRRAWKTELIERVDLRLHTAPVAAPGPSAWQTINAGADEYRRVIVSGYFLNQRETLVQAATEFGGGFWVLTPLRTPGGFTVLVNRGFVPPEKRDPGTRTDGLIAGEVVVAGLVRMTEPKGGFLRSNDPGVDRWYSRDIQAIADARGLTMVAPYFIDADANLGTGALPVGGLTNVTFRNNHLIYAATWYILATMLAIAGLHVVRDEWRLRRGVSSGSSLPSNEDLCKTVL
jgi:surfeit locus 1 family protein